MTEQNTNSELLRQLPNELCLLKITSDELYSSEQSGEIQPTLFGPTYKKALTPLNLHLSTTDALYALGFPKIYDKSVLKYREDFPNPYDGNQLVVLLFVPKNKRSLVTSRLMFTREPISFEGVISVLDIEYAENNLEQHIADNLERIQTMTRRFEGLQRPHQA